MAVEWSDRSGLSCAVNSPLEEGISKKNTENRRMDLAAFEFDDICR
jgi:hypothetical protein